MNNIPHIVFAVVFLAGTLHPASAETVTLTPSKDNTLYEDGLGALSNGEGDYLFTGRTDEPTLRRAVLAFDLDGAVPTLAPILSVDVTLYMSRTDGDVETVALHRLLLDWGEGGSNAVDEEGMGAPSQAGDATWIHTFFPGQNWNTSGGDFTGNASASRAVDDEGFYTWSSAGLLADVQDWRSDPATNFGWIVIGDEVVDKTAKRFNTRENPNAGTRPRLTIEFVGPVFTDDFESGNCSAWSSESCLP